MNMTTNDFFNSVEDNNFFNKYIKSVQEQEWELIIDNWKTGSVQVKNYLNKYFPSELGKYSELANINVNVILPYRHGKFWTSKDLWRLEYAIKAKLIILGVNGIDEVRMLYVTECLRLWLRYDSRYTKLSWPEFRDLVDKCYCDVESNWDEQVKLVQEICIQYKRKRPQTTYKYKAEDFSGILEDMTLNEAYEFWKYYEFPYLLERFKQQKIQDFKVKQLEKYGKIKNNEYAKFMDELNMVQIKELNIRAFEKQLIRKHIKYNKKGLK